ncbi:MAG: hypothetical protein GY711_12520 [bacterium]|nr:hypothetical protein [bacterium]
MRNAPSDDRRHLRPAVLLLALLCACGSTRHRPEGVPEVYEASEVPAALAEAQASLDAGTDAVGAFYRMRAATEATGVEPAVEDQVRRTLERAADRYVDTFTGEDADARELQSLLDLDLPRRVSVRAGIRAAQLWFEQGERQRAYRSVQRVDRKFPHHFERPAAGQLLFDIGSSFAADTDRYGLFFRYSALAPPVLEYLVLNHPSDPNGDEALVMLSEIYEDSLEYDVAIEKHQDLILWFADSPYRPASEAHIPHLRLVALNSPEYDRTALVEARGELAAWLAKYPDHALRAEVEADLGDCLTRLADNDLSVARFYRTVKNSGGAEYHARRAIEEATDGDNDKQIEEATTLLANIMDERASDEVAPRIREAQEGLEAVQELDVEANE